MNEPSILDCFLHREITVEIERNFIVTGKLLAYQSNDKLKHQPSVLVLQNSCGKILVRGDFTLLRG